MDHLTLLGLSNSAEGDIPGPRVARVVSGANPVLASTIRCLPKIVPFLPNSKMQFYVVFLVYSGHKKLLLSLLSHIDPVQTILGLVKGSGMVVITTNGFSPQIALKKV